MLKLILIGGIFINPVQVTSLTPVDYSDWSKDAYKCLIHSQRRTSRVTLTCSEVAVKLTEVKVK
jgi:hypothetical protein